MRQVLNRFKRSKVTSMWGMRHITWQFILRDINSRYRGSNLGIIWSFLTPLMMLCIYTFVFGVIFKSRWGQVTSNRVEYALILFSGLAVFNAFSEVVTRAPNIIVSNVNYVKKVVFPLEIFALMTVGSSLVNLTISFSIIFAGLAVFLGILKWMLLLLPLILLPLIFISLGLSWFLSSLGVYFRDMGQLIGIAVQALMFLTPVFYPETAVPTRLQLLYNLNPLSFIVNSTRDVVIWGVFPNWCAVVLWNVIGALIAFGGFAWFEKTKEGFADVL